MLRLIEARRIISTFAVRLSRGFGRGKGIVAEGAEAQGFPGQTRNTCLTVAFAECYQDGAVLWRLPGIFAEF